MRSRTLLCLCLVAGAAAVAAAANLGEVRAAPPAPPTAGAGSCLMLTIALDANGVRLLRTTPKPGLAFRLPEDHESMPLQWVIRDAAGSVLQRGGCDPGPVCLEPAHAGQPGHVQGDVAIPHELATNLKIPDLGAQFDRLELRWTQDAPRALGTLTRAALGLH